MLSRPPAHWSTSSRVSHTLPLYRWLVEEGGHVSAGEAYAEVEVMKMFLPLVAAESGRISHVAQEGSTLVAGTLVATVVLDDPSQVRMDVAHVLIY
jgi:pyruvate/2-oxoglutarate dehydrogenase complex dihydrolipoamide acyltransferase (E2) component